MNKNDDKVCIITEQGDLGLGAEVLNPVDETKIHDKVVINTTKSNN